MIKEALAAFASTGGEETSLANLEQSYAVDKAELEKSLVVSEEKIADTERHLQEVEHNEGTLDELVTEIDEAAAKFKAFEAYAPFLEDKVFEQSNQLLEKYGSCSGYQKWIVVLEQELAIVTADVKCLTWQRTADKGQVDGDRKALALDNTAAEQRVSAHMKNRRKLLTDKVLVETDFCKFRPVMQTRFHRIQTSLDGKVNRANGFDSEKVRLLFSENSLKRQL